MIYNRGIVICVVSDTKSYYDNHWHGSGRGALPPLQAEWGGGGAHAPGVPLLLPPMLCSFVYTSYARILIKLLVIVIGQSIFGNP